MSVEGWRVPYVGVGAEGARRSAQIDRDELASLALDDPRYPGVEASAARWDRQAQEIERHGS